MDPHAVVLCSDPGEFGYQHRGLGDGLQTRPLTFAMAEERAGVAGGYRGRVVAYGQQDRLGRVTEAQIEPFIGEQLEQAFEFVVLVEHPHLGSGLFDRDNGIDPPARHPVHDLLRGPGGHG